MFTGIVEAIGVVAAVERRASGVRMTVDAGDWRPRSGRFVLGDSVCVSGVCLTLAEHVRTELTFDVITETLEKTRLGGFKAGDPVNLESSLTPATPLGGHTVQGHVDAAATVARVSVTVEGHRVTVVPPADLMDYVVPKGSVALDGVSLTIASVAVDRFDVALIPVTLERTTLGRLVQGDRVNLEADILAKTVVHWLRRRSVDMGSTVTQQALVDAGFMR